MMRTRSVGGAVATVALLACGGVESGGESEAPIVGGRVDLSPRFRAVGALVHVEADGTTREFCTGAVIGPRLVVTAKHCAIIENPATNVAFAIGPEASSPRRLYRVARFTWERTQDRGLMGLGSDVAVGHLAEEVVGIEPITIGEARRAEVGSRFVAVGYGAESYEPDAVIGRRKVAQIKLAGIGPDGYWKLIYGGNFEAFLADYWAGEPVIDEAMRAEARFFWNEDRLATHSDALFSRVTGNTAGGDSGGPIFSTSEGDDLRSVGVVSGIITFGPDAANPIEETQTLYSTFGPEAQYLIRAAEVCGPIPSEGVCEGAVRKRCSTKAEAERDGHIQVFTRNCASSGLGCAQTPDGARCVGRCSNDLDCTGGSRCVGSVCRYTPTQICQGEAGNGFACFLCCLGAEGRDFSDADFETCGATCFGPPGAAAASAPRARVSFPGIGDFPLLPLPTNH